MRVAIFDFDGTLYGEETFPLLMDHLKNHPIYHKNYKKFFLTILPRFAAYKAKVYSESRMKERSTKAYLTALSHLSDEEIRLYFQEIADKMKQNFNSSVLARFEQHKKDGVYTMIVSGAFTLLLDAAMESYSFDEIIGTDIPFYKQFVDQTIPMYQVQGMRKNVKILDALKGNNIDWENSFAYGDSYSDLPVLELVGNPVAVKPDPQLQNIATQRHWEIML